MVRHYRPEDSNLDLSFGMNCGPHHFAEPGFELHTHDFVEMVIVLRGKGLHLTSYGNYPISAGDVFVIHGDVAHGFTESRGMYIVNIMLTEAFLEDTGRWLRQLPGYHSLFVLEPVYRYRHGMSNRLHLSGPDLKLVARLVDVIVEELTQQKSAYQAMVKAHWQQLFTHLCRVFSQVENAPAPFSRLADTIAYMEAHWVEQLPLEALAKRAHLSKNQFMRVFKQHYGVTPNKYLNQLRVEQAREMLKGGRRNMTDIALRCGFGDSNYFARIFKQLVGQSPRAYRKDTLRSPDPILLRTKPPAGTSVEGE